MIALVEPPAAEDLFDMIGDVKLAVRRAAVAGPGPRQKARHFSRRRENVRKGFQQKVLLGIAHLCGRSLAGASARKRRLGIVGDRCVRDEQAALRQRLTNGFKYYTYSFHYCSHPAGHLLLHSNGR